MIANPNQQGRYDFSYTVCGKHSLPVIFVTKSSHTLPTRHLSAYGGCRKVQALAGVFTGKYIIVNKAINSIWGLKIPCYWVRIANPN